MTSGGSWAARRSWPAVAAVGRCGTRPRRRVGGIDLPQPQGRRDMGGLVRERIQRTARQILSVRTPDMHGTRRYQGVRPGSGETSAGAPAGRCREPRRIRRVRRSAAPAAGGTGQGQHRCGVRIAGMPGPAANAAVADLDASGQAADGADLDRAAKQRDAADPHVDGSGALPVRGQGGAAQGFAVQGHLGGLERFYPGWRSASGPPSRHGSACPERLFRHVPRQVARTSRAMT